MTFSYSPISQRVDKIWTIGNSFKSTKSKKVLISFVLVLILFLWTVVAPSFTSSTKKSFPNVLNQLSKQTNQNLNLIKDSTGSNELLDYDRENIKYIYPDVIEKTYNNTDLDSIDWKKYAYVLYATSSNHMCNAMMIFAELRKYKTRAQLVLLVNADFLEEPWNYEYEHATLTAFADKFDVVLKPTKVKKMGDEQATQWLSSFTKLMVFNETDYDRVIYLDSDAILLNDNIDELFFIPPCKMASVTGYWLTEGRYKNQEYKKYSPNDYSFKPLTKNERQNKIQNLIDKTISSFTNKNGKLPINNNDDQPLKSKINQKNFYNNLYNNLPNFKFIEEYSFTNIIMVIQPTPELFERIEESFNHRKHNEFDMDIINFYVFKMSKILDLQKSNKPQNGANSTDELIDDIPEYLILPHQIYGTLTSELNLVQDHASFLADPQDQPFIYQQDLKTTNNEPAYYDLSSDKNPSKQFYPQIKYLHFSDSPIPKPWFEKIPTQGYMSERIRCPSHSDFSKEDITKPKGTSSDCSAGKFWEHTHQLFADVRWDVCQLQLKYTTSDPYRSDIN